MHSRSELMNRLAERERQRQAQEPTNRAAEVARLRAREAKERADREKLQELLDWTNRFVGVPLATGHEIKVQVTDSCWELGVWQDGLPWIQLAIDHWAARPGAIPRAVPLLLLRWSGRDWEMHDSVQQKGFGEFNELTEAVFKKMCELDQQVVKEAIGRTRR